MGGDTLYSGMGRSTDAGFGAGPSTAALSGAGGAGAATGLGIGAGAAAMGGPGMRNSGIVLPRVRDENQSGDRWIETGAEVHVLWPYVFSFCLTTHVPSRFSPPHRFPSSRSFLRVAPYLIRGGTTEISGIIADMGNIDTKPLFLMNWIYAPE